VSFETYLLCFDFDDAGFDQNQKICVSQRRIGKKMKRGNRRKEGEFVAVDKVIYLTKLSIN